MSLFKRLAASAMLVLAASSATAATYGVGKLFTPGDTTVFIEPDGSYLEFLDLNLTLGQTSDIALANYSSYGFHLASATEMNKVWSSFGVTTAATPPEYQFLSMTQAAAIQMESLFGATEINGTYVDLLGIYDHGLVNMGYSVPDNVTVALLHTSSTIDQYWRLNNAGVFLVRDVPAPAAATGLPEPASLALAAAALLGLGLVRRRSR